MRDPIPFTSRSPFTLPGLAALESTIVQELIPVHDMMKDISGGYGYINCSERCLTWFGGYPPNFEPGHHKMIIFFLRNVEGHLLHPIGIQFTLNMDSTDPDGWFVENVWIQGQYFKNFKEVLQARSQNKLTITKIPNLDDPLGESLMSSLHFRGEPRPTMPQRKPHTVMPDGNRFTVSERHIKWMGWDFKFGMLASSGIQIFDVKFLEERIAYELSLQVRISFHILNVEYYRIIVSLDITYITDSLLGLIILRITNGSLAIRFSIVPISLSQYNILTSSLHFSAYM